MQYKDLEKKKPEDYLNPENFCTSFDKDDDYAIEQYKNGLSIGSKMGYIFINDRSVWSAGNSSVSGVISSSEGIGYHKNTKYLLKGFIDSGATINVSRYVNKKFVSTVIQNGDLELLNNEQYNILNSLKNLNENLDYRLLEPLSVKPLMSQIKDLKDIPLSSLNFDINLMSYIDKDNTYYILSNIDIANQNLNKCIKEKLNDKIEESANIIYSKDESNIDYKLNKIKIKIDNKSIKLYIKPKQHDKDQQYVYCIIDRSVKNKKILKNNP